jgi:hypothetical protein
MITTTETPAKNHRVARCPNGHGAYAWPGADPIGCPVCGSGLATTTRMLKSEPWQVLDREEARQASRLAGGLPALIAYTRWLADSHTRNADQAEAEVANGERIMDDTGTAWTLREPYDWEVANGRTGPQRSSGLRIAGCRDAAAKQTAKAERLERKLAKLGGEVTA